MGCPSWLERASQRPGATTAQAPNGGFVVTNQKTATSVYVAYPDSDVEIEIYDPSPQRAMAIATSGTLTPLP